MSSATPSASRRSSASSIQCRGGDIHAPPSSKRAASTAAPASATATLRRSRTPVLRARLTRIRNSQVLIDERASKRSMPRSTATHVSCTTSSAIASLGTNERARCSIAEWCRATSVTKARSSPSRSRRSSSPSPASAGGRRRGRGTTIASISPSAVTGSWWGGGSHGACRSCPFGQATASRGRRSLPCVLL